MLTDQQLSTFEPALFEYIHTVMQQDIAHNIQHVLRVVKTAKALCRQEQGQLAIVLPAAYLHDCFSFAKNHPDKAKSSTIAADRAVEFLLSIDYPQAYHDDIHHAIVAHSYSAHVTPRTREAQIVQDADRLDALGAIGVARCIQVNTQLENEFYSSNDPFCQSRSADDRQFAIDHFYTKLLKLQHTMHTQSAQQEAAQRTQFMHLYLQQLSSEITQED